MSDPLLFCSDLRVDRFGAPEVDGLTLTARATRLALVGAPRALLLAAAGQSLPSRGQLRILGSRPRSLLDRGELATVFFTDSLESARTVQDHLHASAELAGVAKDRRDALANDALTRTKLDAFRRTKLEKASGLVRRGTHLAAALATGAPTVVMSDPAEELDAETARTFVAAVAAATRDKARIAFRARAALAGDAEELVLVFAGGALVAQGTSAELAAETRAFAIDVAGDATAFIAELAARAWSIERVGPTRLRVTLPEGVGTHEAFALAVTTGVQITELTPVAPGVG